jgi:hypothetical protein
LEGIIIPTMEREERELDPNRDDIGDIIFWVKIKIPVV